VKWFGKLIVESDFLTNSIKNQPDIFISAINQKIPVVVYHDSIDDSSQGLRSSCFVRKPLVFLGITNLPPQDLNNLDLL